MERQGIPAEHVLRFLKRLEEQAVCMHGFLLERGGETMAEGYWRPFSAEQPHRMFSISKSMTALAVGMLIGQGKLALSDRIVRFFPEFLSETVPSALEKLVLRDMLRMATCHAFTTYKQTLDANWARTFFIVPPSHEPGTVFAYDTSCSQVLAALVEKLTGMPLLDYLQKNLLDPLGATGAKHWLADPSGTSQGGSGLVMTLRDLVKVAHFCMGDGRGIVPQDFLRAATSKQIGTPMQERPEERHGYGYQFWCTRDGFMMYGMGGQLAICVPRLQLALCTTADTQFDSYGVQRIHDAFFEEIVDRFALGEDAREPETGTETATEATEADRLLTAYLAELSVKPLPSEPRFAVETEGSFHMERNPMGITELWLEPGALCLLRGDQSSGGEWKRIAFGMGSMARGEFPGSSEPCIASAGWVEPGVLRVLCHIIGDTPCGVDILLAFAGEAVVLQAKRVQDPITAGFSGIASGHRVQGARCER